MHLFADYIQPITMWLETHSNWALFFAFAISFTESLAVIGSIIPGSVTMTAIGFLAGSGVMRIDLTLIAATLGAIAGDSLSYLLGYTFSDRLNSIWPFSRNPRWLDYGKDYFSKHGGKSVLIGRFVGPLRSIIPVIAGMMHMSHWRFFSANVISGIAWSLLYVLPGVIIGAASNELSPESATRLFALILFVLVGVWLLSVAIKWLVITVNRFLRIQLHDFWSWSEQQPVLGKFTKALTPLDEKNHYATTTLFLGLIFSLILFFVITLLVIQGAFIDLINQPSYLFLQSLRLFHFDVFFIFISGFINSFSLVVLNFFIVTITIYYRQWRSLRYWMSLNLSCVLVLLVTHVFIDNPVPEGLLEINDGNSYPALHLTFATAQFSALLFYLNSFCKCRFNRVLNVALPIILLLAGMASLYLGDNWLVDCIGAYLCGFSLCLLHWIFYRRERVAIYQPCLAPLIVATLVSSTLFSMYFNFGQSIRLHQTYLAQYMFTDSLWWNQTTPLLPIYRTNRIGRRISLFNIQYTGTLSHLETALLAYGWHKESESLFKSLLKRVNDQQFEQDSPLMAQLYLNRKPVLIMTYKPKNGQPTQILRIWRSNYHLKNFRQPIWVGTVNIYAYSKQDVAKNKHPFVSSLNYITEALPQFSKRLMQLRITLPHFIPYPYEPTLLLIKEAPPLRIE